MEKNGKIVQLHGDDRGKSSLEPASCKKLIVDLESPSCWFQLAQYLKIWISFSQ